ncbi:MAG TPA: hypothetical protein VHN99_07830 [Deinococcales bacterium]|nr:hypothetical protein [Deinococcales bacterium]
MTDAPAGTPHDLLRAYLRYVEYNFAFAGREDRDVMCRELRSLARDAGARLDDLLGGQAPEPLRRALSGRVALDDELD